MLAATVPAVCCAGDSAATVTAATVAAAPATATPIFRYFIVFSSGGGKGQTPPAALLWTAGDAWYQEVAMRSPSQSASVSTAGLPVPSTEVSPYAVWTLEA
ncbi:hypothetical protein Airi01_096130 [Actinoallomurus iriomotensis]|uniref:Secreted protein n=1 Tax=Actinoallomurus iriomotensis TaxID=478107 RepID=A0A9W6RT08_9ACTN|nr:hypothetical protein Airi01_096130 [Actinoallomurus iriomotensis]